MDMELHPTITDAAEAIIREGGLDDDARNEWTERLVRASLPDRHDDLARQLFLLVAKHRRIFPDASDDVPTALCVLAVSLLVEAKKPAAKAKRATAFFGQKRDMRAPSIDARPAKDAMKAGSLARTANARMR